MTGLDCNILVHLAFADHPANVKTLAVVQAETQSGHQLVLPELVITEFLHVATDQRRFDPPLSMIEALDWMENLLANPTVKVLASTSASINLTLRWMRQLRLGHKRILDTHLTAVLHTAGVGRLVTANPSDVAIFGVLEIITP